jgi:hypothetical protein
MVASSDVRDRSSKRKAEGNINQQHKPTGQNISTEQNHEVFVPVLQGSLCGNTNGIEEPPASPVSSIPDQSPALVVGSYHESECGVGFYVRGTIVVVVVVILSIVFVVFGWISTRNSTKEYWQGRNGRNY